MQFKISPIELRLHNIVGRRYYNPHPTKQGYAVEPVFVKIIRENGEINITVSLKEKMQVKIICADLVSIPLTEDWMKRFKNITRHESDGSHWYAFQVISKEHNSGVIIIKWWYGKQCHVELGKGFSKVCETVHEFQNFIRYLTNHEPEFIK